jgi:hypothetical protein
MKNPYGLNDGRLVPVSEVCAGLACDCTCPACGNPLQAHKGDINNHYFAHNRGADCGAGYQTAIHILAKEILETEKRLFLPHLRVEVDRSLLKAGTSSMHQELIPRGQIMRFDEVVLEKRIGEIIPDVLMQKGDRRLLVEITVTHGIDAAKLARLEELNISTVEFDFRRFSQILTRDDLKRELLFNKSRCARWAFHVDERATRERLNKEYTTKYLTPQRLQPVPRPPPQNVLFT